MFYFLEVQLQPKTFVKISSVMSGAMLAALFMLRAIMPRLAERWVQQGIELNLAQRILIGVAAFWSRFWWSEWPLVIGAVFLFVGVMMLFQRAIFKGYFKLESH
jgi:type II secretory pathway component PulF